MTATTAYLFGVATIPFAFLLFWLAGRVAYLMRTPERNRIKAKMAAIDGEPCGQMLCQCKNPRHSEYFYLNKELWELDHGKDSEQCSQ